MLVAGAFLAAFVVGAAGFGDALILAAVWLHVLEPGEMVPLVVSCGVVMYGTCMVRLRGGVRPALLWPFVAGGAAGVPVGSWLLRFVEPEPFRLAVGVFLVLYTGYALLAGRLPRVTAGGRVADGGVGLAGGVLGGLAGLSGILPTLWCGMRGFPKDVQRGIYQPYVLAMHGMAFGWLAFYGAVDAGVAVHFAWCLPAVLAGTLTGLRLYARLDEAQFRRIILATLAAAGVLLVAT